MVKGGLLIDTHSPSVLSPSHPVSLAIHLGIDPTSTAMLWDRLSRRGYSDEKIRENVQCEIMRTVEEEIEECFGGNGARPTGESSCEIMKLHSNQVEDLEKNADLIMNWILKYLKHDSN